MGASSRGSSCTFQSSKGVWNSFRWIVVGIVSGRRSTGPSTPPRNGRRYAKMLYTGSANRLMRSQLGLVESAYIFECATSHK